MSLFEGARRGFSVLFTLITVILFVTPTAEASLNQRARDLYNQRIVNLYFGKKCLNEDIGSPTHNGTRVQAWDCNGGKNQQWSYYSTGEIVSGDGLCLDADISSPIHNGTRVQVWTCNGNKNQRWKLFTNTGIGPINSLALPYNIRCLDEDIAAPINNGTIVQIWDCNSGDNQAWSHQPSP